MIGRVIHHKGQRLLRPIPDGEPQPCDPALPIGAIVRTPGDHIIAEPKSALAALYATLEHTHVDPEHSEASHEEAAAIVDVPRLDDGTEDMRDVPFVTIDNHGSRDLDQALFCEHNDAGLRVLYALADASFYVAPHSALWAEAVGRGASYYLPAFAVPMLPASLSEGVISLNPDVDRRAVVFDTQLDASGRVVATRIVRAQIRSRAKLTYPGVQAYFDAPAGHAYGAAPFRDSLHAFRDVGELRMQRGRDRGVISFHRREAEVEIEDGEFRIYQRDRLQVERWNEQLSLLCNIEGARLLREAADNASVQPIFRVHPPPLRQAQERLAEVLTTLADTHGLDGRWRWHPDSDQVLADFLDSLPRDGAHARLTAAIELQVRYIQRSSIFSADIGPHYALGVDGYARFSSPMREIVGIFTHKELLELLGVVPRSPELLDTTIRNAVIAAANDAKRRQKRLDKAVYKLAIDQLLEGDLRHEERRWHSGTVIGVSSSRAYVLLDDYPVELRVYRRGLEQTYGTPYAATETALIAEGDGPTLRIGDGVKIAAAAHERDKWFFWVEPLAAR